MQTSKITAAAILIALCGALPCAAKDLVVVYPAYSDGRVTVVEGRVTKAEEVTAPTADDGARDNLSRNLELMSNEERKDRPVSLHIATREWQATTDKEGYFRVAIEDLALTPGWHTITAQSGEASGASRLLVVPGGNVHGVISDVDDTIQITEVNSKHRMLANTFLQNPLQREVVPGIVEFYRELADANPQAESAPVFYLSASPRQLHGSLELFLQHNAFTRGVLITKRVTNDSTSEPLSDQFAYKTAKLEEILARLPRLKLTFIGDDGEQDPEIFQALRQKFPERVAAIWIRRVNPDPKRAQLANQGNLNERLAQKKTPQ